MHKFGIIFACVAAAILVGCFVGSDKEIRYYTLPVQEGVDHNESTVYPYSLLVTRATIDPAYRRNNIVYRESPYDFMYYTYSVWSSRPEFLVEQVAKAYIKSQALFKVLEYDDAEKPDMEFKIHVNAMEEVDKGDERYARLALMFTLQKTDADNYIWRKNYDKSKRYDSSDMRNLAEAEAELLQSFLEDAVNEIKQTVK